MIQSGDFIPPNQKKLDWSHLEQLGLVIPANPTFRIHIINPLNDAVKEPKHPEDR